MPPASVDGADLPRYGLLAARKRRRPDAVAVVEAVGKGPRSRIRGSRTAPARLLSGRSVDRWTGPQVGLPDRAMCLVRQTAQSPHQRAGFCPDAALVDGSAGLCSVRRAWTGLKAGRVPPDLD